jgi:hypothetical protein
MERKGAKRYIIQNFILLLQGIKHEASPLVIGLHLGRSEGCKLLD